MKRVSKEELKAKIKKNKKKLIFAGIMAGLGCGVAGYYGIKVYGRKQYMKATEEVTKAAYDISYEKMKRDMIDGFLNEKFNAIDKGAKITIYDDIRGRKAFLVGEKQQLDFVNSCVDHVPEVKAHMQLRFGNPKAETRQF